MLASSASQILMSPTNNSTAKAQYSFPKSPRFPKVSTESSSFYNIPPFFSPRTTTFGYGKKSDFTQFNEKTPDPGEYKVAGDIKNTGKAFSFGISRDRSKRYIEGHFIADPSIPGPGTYSVSPKFGKEGKNIIISGKRQEINKSDLTPGPGAYDQKWEVSKGKYVLSTLKNQEVHTFAPSSFSRFPKTSQHEVPAPGSYETDKGFLRNSEVLSTFKSSGARKFGVSERQFMSFHSPSPGPGSYRLPSEFGYYDSPRSLNSKSTDLKK